MTRQERRQLALTMRKQAASWPPFLVEVPMAEWPARVPLTTRPVAVWRSNRYLVVRYPEPPFNGVEVRRLTVNRVTLARDGGWEENISWDELQRCKRESGHAHWYGVEIYPRDRDIVNDANMRHLWLLAEPLMIGWFGEP